MMARERGGVRQAAAIFSVLAAMALVVLDAGIANVALPTIAGSLRIAPAQSVWVVTAYQAGLVMALLPCAALAESAGHRRVFTAGIALFVLASAGCAAAPSLKWLIAARFAQGLGGAAIMALGIALLREVVGPARLGSAIGWNALNVALCSAGAPALGAAILEVATWHWLFLVNLPLGAVALLAATTLPVSEGDGRRNDFQGFALLGVAFLCLIAGAELLPAWPAIGLGLLALSVPPLARLWRRDADKSAPLVPFDLLRGRSFRLSVMASVCCFTGQTAALVILPFYLQQGLGLSTIRAGLIMTAWPLSVASAGPLAGYLSARMDGGRLSATGCIALAAGLAGFALWPAGTDPFLLMIPGAICGAGFGFFQVPNNRNMFLSAPAARSAAAGGMQGTARLTGQTAGSVLAALMLAATPIGMAATATLAIGSTLVLAAGVASRARRPGRRSEDQAASSFASSP